MITIERSEPKTLACDCCGGTTTSLTRFVYEDGNAHAVYYAAFSDNHPERLVELVVSVGEWGEDSTPGDRCAFALLLRATTDQFQVTVIDASDSRWKSAVVVGRLLNRKEALAHPRVEEIFHITDHIVVDDPEIRVYLDPGPVT